MASWPRRIASSAVAFVFGLALVLTTITVVEWVAPREGGDNVVGSVPTDSAGSTGAPPVSQTLGPTRTAVASVSITVPPNPEPIDQTGGAASIAGQLFDDFNDGILNPAKWTSPTDPKLIYEGNGVLNFEITAPPSETIGSKLDAITQLGRIEQVTYTATVVSSGANKSAGARLDLLLANGRLLQADVGTSEGGPGTEFLACPNSTVGYSECNPQPGRTVAVGEKLEMKAVWTSGAITFYIGVDPAASFPVDGVPVVGFGFSMYGDKDSVFHVGVDNVNVK